MTSKLSYLEAKVTAGNFILGLMVLLLAFEYFTSRYLSRFPDYRLSYLIGAVTVAYFLALRFINYNKRREMPILQSAFTSALDLLTALGAVGIAVWYGNYPVAFLLNVDPSLYAFAPPGSIPIFVLTAAFALFIVPRAATQFFLPPIPKLRVASRAPVGIKAGNLEELVAALEQTTNEMSVVDPRNAKLLFRLAKVLTGLGLELPGLEPEGPSAEGLPEVVGWPGAVPGQLKSRWSKLIVIGLEPAAPLGKEALTNVLVDNPWATILAKRALRGPGKAE